MNQIKKKLKYGLLAFLVLPFFLGGISNADDGGDLLWKVWGVSDTKNTVIHLGTTAKVVGEETIGKSGQNSSKETMLTRITKILLGLAIALSVTMILYNGMIYIIQTGQGKEGKDLMKNVMYIVIGVVIALFSTIIIALIQSITTSIDTELKQNSSSIDSSIF